MTTANALPADVRKYVGRFVARRRGLSLVKAGGVALAFVLFWVLVWCFVDRLTGLPSWARLAVGCAGAAGVIAILFRPLWRALRRRIDWVEAAAEIERQDPAFGQRLETVTSQLLDRPEYRGSPAILAQLQAEVSAEVSTADARRLIPWRRVARPWMVAAVLVIVLAGLAPVRWLNLPVLIGRLVRPLSSIAPVTTTLLSVSPGDQDVPQGQPLTIQIKAQHLGQGQVRMHLSEDGHTWSRLAMTPLGEDRFGFTLEAVERDMRYYVSGGDAQSPQYQVRVQRKPGVSDFRIRYVYPPYTGRSPLVVTNSDGLVEAPVKTEATVAVTSTEPLASATLRVGGRDLPMSKTVDPNVRQATITVSKDEPYHVMLLSDRHVRGEGPATTAIHALPDRAPMVRLLQPGEDLRLHPMDLLAIQYEALDDYGIGSLSLRVQVNASAARELPLRPRGDPRRQIGQSVLDLATLDLKIGDVIVFSVSATDKAGQSGRSEVRHVLVSPRSIDLNTHLRIAELQESLHLANTLAEQLSSAEHAQSADPTLASFQIDQDIAGAGETAVLLRQRLLRADIRSGSAPFSLTIAALVDRAQVAANMIDNLTRILAEVRDPNMVRDLVSQSLRSVHTLQEDLKTLTTAEQAAAVLADRNNLAASEKIKPADKAALERQRQTLDRVRDDIARAARTLGLNAAAASLDAQLRDKINKGDALMKRQHPVDFPAVAREWAGLVGKTTDWRTGLSGRLVAGAQAEAVRPEGNLVRARDLQLAARAAARLTAMGETPGATTQPALTEPLKQYPPALTALQREHDLDRQQDRPPPAAQAARIHQEAADARRKMAQWAGEAEPPAGNIAPDQSAEELALQAGAAAQRKDFDRAEQLDAALANRLNPASAAATQPAEADKTFAENHTADASSAHLTNQPHDAAAPSIDAHSKANAPTAMQAQRSPEETAAADDAQRRRREQVRQAMAAAKQIDQIVRQQEQVSADTERAAQEQLSALAARQQQVAEAIEQVRRQHQEAQAGDLDAQTAQAAEAQADSREAALKAIQQAQARLAAMPQQLTAARQAIQAQRQAAARADQAHKALAAAPTAAQAAAQRAMQQAQRDLADATQRTAEAARQVNPDVAQALSVQLAGFAPDTTPAAQAIDEHLTPALRELDQSMAAHDMGGVDRSADAARQAIDRVQKELRDAQERVNERDPILAAKWFAQQAAAELRRRPPDVAQARQDQHRISQSLVRAQGNALHSANAGRLAQTAILGSLYRLYDLGGAVGSGAEALQAIKSVPGLREWGLFRERTPAELNSSLRESDPPGYQDALKAYFEALGKASDKGSK